MCLCKNYEVLDYSAIYTCKSLEIVVITNYETQYIDIEKLKNKQKIYVYIREEDKFDDITNINYSIDLDYKLNKDNSKTELIKTVFDIRLDLFLKNKNQDKLKQIKEIEKVHLNDIKNAILNLKGIEKDIEVEIFENLKSPREIIKS